MKPTREEVLEKALKEIAADICDNKYTKIARAAITDSDHVAVISAKPDSVNLAEPAETSTDTSLDAARWRALLSSGRIRILGSAGFSAPPKGYESSPDYRHFGMEIWTSYGKPGGYDFSPDNAYGRNVLTKYADAIIAAQSGMSAPKTIGQPNERNDVVQEGKQ